MSPTIARELILRFSRAGDVVLDPFMGSGTTLVEALAHGRGAVGVDLNPIAHFLTLVRTTGLSQADDYAVWAWAVANAENGTEGTTDARWDNLPHGALLASLVERAELVDFPRRRRFIKAALLRLAQWTMDRRREPPTEVQVRSKLLDTVGQLREGVEELTAMAASNGLSLRHLHQNRLVMNRTALHLSDDRRVKHLYGKVRLVLTSPPYPAVHVLYHRWQVQSRRETPAPYWIIGAQDGHGLSHYTMGSRTPTGLRNYFRSIQVAFESVRPLLTDDAHVCLMLAFRDPDAHLALFEEAMYLAGFKRAQYDPLWRDVPHRRWYATLQDDQSAAREVLLIFRPRQ